MMKYCAHCGMALQDEETHLCGGEASPYRAASGFEGPKISRSSFIPEPDVLLNLLRNPLAGLRLNPENGLIYGILGMAASLIGFFLWGLALEKKIEDSLSSVFGGFFLFDWVKPNIHLAEKFLPVGLVSLQSLVGALWIMGLWKGEHRSDWREVITVLGSMQLTWAACFLGGALIAFVSLQLSVLVVGIALLSALVITLLGAHDLFRIREERRLLTITGSIALYVLLTGYLGFAVL